MPTPCQPHANPMPTPCQPHANPMRPHANPMRPHANTMRPHANPMRPHASPMRPHSSGFSAGAPGRCMQLGYTGEAEWCPEAGTGDEIAAVADTWLGRLWQWMRRSGLQLRPRGGSAEVACKGIRPQVDLDSRRISAPPPANPFRGLSCFQRR
jgi:hypothetical protein